MASISGEDKRKKIERIINSRSTCVNGNIKYEYLVKLIGDPICTWVFEDNMRDIDVVKLKYEHACDVIQKINKETCEVKTQKFFGFKSKSKNKRAIKVKHVLQIEGILVCEVDWKKDEKSYSDFVSYYEILYEYPYLLFPWYDKYVWDTEEHNVNI